MKKGIQFTMAIFVLGILVMDTYVILNRIGLAKGLDFGAGAYYYTDIPKFEIYMNIAAASGGGSKWIFWVIFLVWGVLMYLFWKKIDGYIDKRKINK